MSLRSYVPSRWSLPLRASVPGLFCVQRSGSLGPRERRGRPRVVGAADHQPDHQRSRHLGSRSAGEAEVKAKKKSTCRTLRDGTRRCSVRRRSVSGTATSVPRPAYLHPSASKCSCKGLR